MNESILDRFKHKIPLHIRYDDLDTMGHVNNKVYLSYLEEGRINYIRDVYGFDMQKLAFNMVVARIDISYKLPLFIHDKTVLYTRCSRIGSKSFDMESLVVREGITSEIISKSVVTLVTIDTKTGRAVPNGRHEMQAIIDFEQNPELKMPE